MRNARHWLVAALALAALVAITPRVFAGDMSLSATPSGATVTIDFGYWEDPNYPTGHPEFVGYDLRRTDASDCNAPQVIVNPQPFPRSGNTENFTFVDTPPAAGHVWRYQAIMVDAQRNPLLISPPSCFSCTAWSYAPSPPDDTPTTIGTVQDWGWAVFIQPCAGSCLPSLYVDGPSQLPLRAFIGTNEVVRLFGAMGCGSVEGCGMRVDHWDVYTCNGPVATRQTSWGALKSYYR
jgi:hypothetical protein